MYNILTGNITLAMEDWKWNQLSWDDQGDPDASKEFYNQLWDPNNNEYNLFWQRCTSENGTWLTPMTTDGISAYIPTNFTPYNDNQYNCNETNINPNPPVTESKTIDNMWLFIGIMSGGLCIGCIVVIFVLRCICCKKPGGWRGGQELGNYGKLQNV